MTTLTTHEISLQSNTDVLGYIQARNAERNAQAKAEGWTFWTLMAESLADEYTNVYEMELEFARSAYSDSHKDWAGFRGYVSEELTLEQVEAEVSKLAARAAEEYKAEQEWVAEQDKLMRDEVAMGIREPAEEDVLEQWEVYEAAAEAEGY
jgi:hypothetical protein